MNSNRAVFVFQLPHFFPRASGSTRGGFSFGKSHFFMFSFPFLHVLLLLLSLSALQAWGLPASGCAQNQVSGMTPFRAISFPHPNKNHTGKKWGGEKKSYLGSHVRSRGQALNHHPQRGGKLSTKRIKIKNNKYK